MFFGSKWGDNTTSSKVIRKKNKNNKEAFTFIKKKSRIQAFL